MNFLLRQSAATKNPFRASLNNSTTCKFVYILDLFSSNFTKFRVETYKQNQPDKKHKKQDLKKKKNNLCDAFLYSVWFYRAIGSVNCVALMG